MNPKNSQCDTKPPSADQNTPAEGIVTSGGEAALLDVIADLAAGAAHELNNPLTVISGRAQLMREQAPKPSDRKTWALIADQAHRISDIITNLMKFASPPHPEPAKIKTGILLKNIITFFSDPNLPNAKAPKIDKEIEDSAPDIWGDPAQVDAVIKELITNALNAAETRPYIRLRALAAADGKDVLIVIEDDGPGMDTETLASAFTPFYSSQTAGRRRGMGLPMAWRYVANNHGKIWLQSTPGNGTKAYVQFPAALDGPKHNWERNDERQDMQADPGG